MTLQELSDEQLENGYVVTLKQYRAIYKQLKDYEEEKIRRFNDGSESR